MANDHGDKLVPGPADETMISLSQLILAPLDAVFKAQVHAARSFLSFVLQLSYDHREDRPESVPEQADRIHSVTFSQELPASEADGPTLPKRMQTVSVPALALVPLRPLAIEEAEFDLAMEVRWIAPHRQTRQKERFKANPAPDPSGEDRPWYLVDDPISLRGHVAPQPPDGEPRERRQDENPVIKLNVKIGHVAMPSGLEKLLTTLTQSASVVAGPSKQ